KASANYQNGSWDLVDACKDGKVKLSEIKREELPAELQKLSESDRKSFVDSKAKEREKIQQQISKLNVERTQFVAKQMKTSSNANTLDTVMVTAIREQAIKKNYRFE